MARRGFFAELQHQNRVASREREKAERAAFKQREAALRRSEQARKSLERAHAQLVKASEAERKRAEKEAREAHLAAMEAEVDERNGKLAETYDDIDSLLSSTLSVDDYVDLNSLRVSVTHPPFATPLSDPIPEPQDSRNPAPPPFVKPAPPTGFAKLFGKKKYERALATARQSHEQSMEVWKANCLSIEESNKVAREKHAQEEARRVKKLEAARQKYVLGCATTEAEAAVANQRLDELIANLGYGTADAIQEYLSIVLSNSAYPDSFQVTHDFKFEPTTAELGLQVLLPGPTAIPDIKLYKYAKATDEIVSTSLSQKECRDRYASAVHQVALRTFHEVFESDRRGLIKTISLEVGTDAVDPATGQRGYIPFVIAAAERDSFLAFDLSAVIPVLTLGKLGAAISKNPYGLIPAERAGVRRS